MSYALNWKLCILAASYFNALVHVVTIGGYELILQLYKYGKLLVIGWMVCTRIFSLTQFVLIGIRCQPVMPKNEICDRFIKAVLWFGICVEI